MVFQKEVVFDAVFTKRSCLIPQYKQKAKRMNLAFYRSEVVCITTFLAGCVLIWRWLVLLWSDCHDQLSAVPVRGRSQCCLLALGALSQFSWGVREWHSQQSGTKYVTWLSFLFCFLYSPVCLSVFLCVHVRVWLRVCVICSSTWTSQHKSKMGVCNLWSAFCQTCPNSSLLLFNFQLPESLSWK